MIISSLKVKLPPEKHLEAFKIIRPILGPTKIKPGCMEIGFYQETDDSNVIFLLEKWETLNDLKNHIRSREYRNVLELMDLSIKEPEINFDTVSKSEGMELISTLKD